MKFYRQFEVTHLATGTVTRVLGQVWRSGRTVRSESYLGAARHAGHRYPVDCTVRIVPVAQEIPLPFDELPLVIRRNASHD